MTIRDLDSVPAARRLWVYGSGGHGKVVAETAQLIGWGVSGFIDDAPGPPGRVLRGKPVVSWDELLKGVQGPVEAVALGIGENDARARCWERARSVALEMPILIHPRASVSPSARLGDGTVVLPNAVVNADTEVGSGVIINSGAVVEHDCRIGDFAHVGPGAIMSGGARLGASAALGAGAVMTIRASVENADRIEAGVTVYVPMDS